MDWRDFYIVMAGASATLIGLLFVAVQFNLDSVAREPGSQWRAISRSTLTLYITLFLVPLLFLVPVADAHLRGEVLLGVGLFGAIRVLRYWWPVWRARFTREGNLERAWHAFWLMLAPTSAYLYLGYTGWQMLQGDTSPGPEFEAAVALLSLMLIALRNSWNLLVEASYERKDKS